MFLYKNDILVLMQGDCAIPIQEIIKNQTTPFYLYDIQGLREWYRFFLQATDNRLKVFFAMKANANQHILKAFQEETSGIDVVSGGEARLAQKAGFSPQKIIFSGVGKSTWELEEAVEKGFFQINVESLGELERLADICRKKNNSCSIGLRINPNVDFSAHSYIKTGLSGHKFGFEEEELPLVLKLIHSQDHLQLKGLSMHLGSQIFDLEPLFQAIRQIKQLYEKLKKENHSLTVIDIGGGLAVNYQKPDLEEEKIRLKKFGQGLKTIFRDFEGTVISEPGRLLTAPFGILCAKIEYIKKSPKKQFVILNSGMNHFLRPALYGAKHRILPLKKSEGPQQIYDVTGPICETGDIMAKNYPLPELKSEDWLAIADTGAYGFVMANQYNGQPLPREISFDQGKILHEI